MKKTNIKKSAITGAFGVAVLRVMFDTELIDGAVIINQ